MTMPGARKIEVEGRTYAYVLKDGDHRLAGWTGKTIRLVVELREGNYKSNVFRSKLWTAEHEDFSSTAPAHKASFTPGDVRAVVTTLEFNQGELPIGFETATWQLTTKGD